MSLGSNYLLLFIEDVESIENCGGRSLQVSTERIIKEFLLRPDYYP